MTLNAAPMRTQSLNETTQQDRAANRFDRVRAEDPQFRDSVSLETVAAKRQSGLRIAQIVQIIIEGYAERRSDSALASW